MSTIRHINWGPFHPYTVGLRHTRGTKVHQRCNYHSDVSTCVVPSKVGDMSVVRPRSNGRRYKPVTVVPSKVGDMTEGYCSAVQGG